MRLLLAAAATLALAVSIACGDDGPGVTPASTQAPSATLPPLLPTPTSIPSNLPVLSVATFQKESPLTADDLRALAKTEVDAKGKKTGASLAALAEKVQASPASPVTVRGFSPDGRRDMFIRYPLSEVGATTILVVDQEGYVSLWSSSIPEKEWLTHVVSVSFP